MNPRIEVEQTPEPSTLAAQVKDAQKTIKAWPNGRLAAVQLQGGGLASDASEPTPRDRALALYQAPFRYQAGYIWDANGKMVADEAAQDCVTRIRGWGRIRYLPDAENLQDEVGALIAEILSNHWN